MFTEINNSKIWIDIEGKGETAIFLPSYGGNLHFQRLLPIELREKYKLIFIEPRGSGRSENNTKISFDILADDFETLRKDLNLKKIAIMGWSANGFLAFEYALKYTQSVSHLILSGTPPHYKAELFEEQSKYWEVAASEKRKKIYEEQLAKFRKSDLSNLTDEEKIVGEYAASGPKYWFNENYDCKWIWENNALKANALKMLFYELLSNYDPTSKFNSVDVPVLILQGKHDYLVPHYMMENHIDSFKKCTYHLFEQSGHYPFFEERELFLKVINKFLASK
jgi:proline iminopeptidase